MADTEHLKCFARKGVRVQVPPSAPNRRSFASFTPTVLGGPARVRMVTASDASSQLDQVKVGYAFEGPALEGVPHFDLVELTAGVGGGHHSHSSRATQHSRRE